MIYSSFKNINTEFIYGVKAFLKAWAAVCGAQKSEPLLVIPGGKTFLLYPVTFRGPCSSSSVNIQVN